MKVTKLAHSDTYTVKTAEDCHTFFDEVLPHGDLGCVELRVHTYVSGALYGDNAADFLKAWEQIK